MNARCKAPAARLDDNLLLALAEIETIEQFKSWTCNHLRAVLPHGALISGLGHLHAGGVGLDYLVLVDYPPEHIESIRNRMGAIDSPIVRRWLSTQQPVYFNADNPWPDTPEVWLTSFRRHHMQNVFAHAQYDHVRCVGTYHSIYRVPLQDGDIDMYIETLRTLVPGMHEALCRAIDHIVTPPSKTTFADMTERERRVLHWLRLGKTNAEIAEQVSLSRNTVKHHVTNILDKLGVSNRAQLVRHLSELEARPEPGPGPRLL